jgi:hypothetical protein
MTSRSCTVATVERERPRIDRSAIARMARSATAPTAIQTGSTQVVVVVCVDCGWLLLLLVVVVVLDCELLPELPLWLGALVCVEVVVLLFPCANASAAHETISRLRASKRLPARREKFDRSVIRILLFSQYVLKRGRACVAI